MSTSKKGWWHALLSGAGLIVLGALAARFLLTPKIETVPATEIEAARAGKELHLIKFDSVGRLAGYPGKPDVPCPAQTDRTMVLLVAGQSNAANAAGQRYAAPHGERVLSLYDGRCTPAHSPLLGSTGEGGEAWTALGNKLVEAGLFDRILIVPVAVSGSGISRWGEAGDLRPVLSRAVENVRKTYTVTHVIWWQGETDFAIHTDPADYARHLRSVVDTIREAGATAPIFITVGTRCANSATEWQPDNPIARVQRDASALGPNVFPGFDADAQLNGFDRYDDCHLAASGIEKVANGWVAIFRKAIAR